MLTSGWNHWHHPCSFHVNREPLLKSVFNHHNPKQSKYFEHLTKDSYSQLTAKSASGTFGTAAVWPVAVEPRREQGTSLRNQRMEELCVRILRKQWTATLTNAQVRSSILLLIFISSWALSWLPSQPVEGLELRCDLRQRNDDQRKGCRPGTTAWRGYLSGSEGNRDLPN